MKTKGMKLWLAVAGLVAVGLMLSCQSPKEVDLIVYNARVYTVDADFSVQEAFAVKDGKFVETGSTELIRGKYKAKESIDAGGLPVYPGFYDAHAHFYGFAQTLMQADLTGAASFDEILSRLQAFRGEFPDAAWLVGRGWDQNLWPVKAFPDRAALDALFPDIPVYIIRVDGHAALANSKALELAGIKGPAPVEGGSIEFKNGRLTGILVDNAMNAVAGLIPDPTEEELITLLKKAEALCAEVGLTTVSDAGLYRPELEFLDRLYQEGILRIRNNAMIHISDENLDYYLEKGPYVSDRFTAHTFKILADGALGSRGACLLEPYSDDPSSGFLLFSKETIDKALSRIIDSEF